MRRPEARSYAVVPEPVIYPGQQIGRAQFKQVEVTNPNLAGDYAQSVDEVEGKVTKKTLLPDHAIYVSALRDPFAVNRGTQVRLIFDGGTLQITALGIPLEEGGYRRYDKGSQCRFRADRLGHDCGQWCCSCGAEMKPLRLFMIAAQLLCAVALGCCSRRSAASRIKDIASLAGRS